MVMHLHKAIQGMHWNLQGKLPAVSRVTERVDGGLLREKQQKGPFKGSLGQYRKFFYGLKNVGFQQDSHKKQRLLKYLDVGVQFGAGRNSI